MTSLPVKIYQEQPVVDFPERETKMFPKLSGMFDQLPVIPVSREIHVELKIIQWRNLVVILKAIFFSEKYLKAIKRERCLTTFEEVLHSFFYNLFHAPFKVWFESEIFNLLVIILMKQIEGIRK